MKQIDIMEYISRLSRLAKRRPTGGHRLSRSAYIILKILENEEKMQLSDLSQHLDIRASSLSEILSKMTHHDLIQRTKSEIDSRVINVSITDKGRNQLKKNIEIFEALSNEVSEVLTAEEQQQFADISQKLISYFEAKGSDLEKEKSVCHHKHRKHENYGHSGLIRDDLNKPEGDK